MKRTLTISLVIFSITFLVFIVIPSWIRNGSQQELITWYPNFGNLLYYFFSKFIYLQLFLSAITPFFYFLKFIKSKLYSSKKISKLSSYTFEDLLHNRKFTIHLFLRLLCLCYLVAFSSLLYQYPLISENGLIPYKEFATVTLQHNSLISSIFTYPSLFWISQSNWFILTILWSAVIVSILGILKIYKTFTFFWLWACYLSIVTFGRDLFQFPWDTFLLEIGILTAIATIYILNKDYLPRFIWFTILILFGRQWLSMGMTKLLWSDSTWHDLTYMKYFWLNQPSPTPLAWYSYQLSMPIQKILTLFTIVGELLIPIALFFGRKGRFVAFVISLLFSITIELNGNFGFFNLITAILGIWCLDDNFFKVKSDISTSKVNSESSRRVGIHINIFVYLIITFNIFYLVNLCVKQEYHANLLNYKLIPDKKYAKYDPTYYFFELGKLFSHFRIASPHGVFKGISKVRIRMEIYTEINGKWEKVTPNIGTDITNFSFVAPFMNRLPFLFYYHSYGIDFRKNNKRIFPSIAKLNPNTFYFDPWLKKLISGIFNQHEETRKLMKFEMNKPIQSIKIIGRHLDIKMDKQKCSFNQNGEIIFSKKFTKNDKINIPIYTTQEISKTLSSYK